MNIEFTTILQKLIAEQGENILGDPEQLKIFVRRDAANVPKEERIAFGRAIEAGCYPKIKNAKTSAERNKTKAVLVGELHKSYGIALNHCMNALDILDELTGQSQPAPRIIPAPAAPQPVPQKAKYRRIKAFFAPRNRKKLYITSACAALVVITLVLLLALRPLSLTCEPLVEHNGEAYPAKALAINSMKTRFDGAPRMVDTEIYAGDTLGDFGVRISANREAVLRVEIESGRYIKKSSIEFAAKPHNEIEVFPRIMYDIAALEALVQPHDDNVFFRVYEGNTLKKEIGEVVRFHSVNDVPFRHESRWEADTVIDNTWLFAAYVNEDDPFIDKITQEALLRNALAGIGEGSSASFFGYQGTKFNVLEQVFAVWNVLQHHKIKYSNIAVTSSGNQKVLSQYVRTLQESFENTQANCVDGTVLFASILRKIGIEPYLVLMPGHMFLGFSIDGDKEIVFLETTMIGDVDISGYRSPNRASLNSFLEAFDEGSQKWESIKDKILDDDELLYQLISIAECRAAGIMPVKRN